MNRSILRRAVALALTGTCLMAGIPVNAMNHQALFINFLESDIGVNVNEKEKIDLILTKGESNIDLSTFKEDVSNALKNQNIDISNLNIQAIETSTVDSNAFDASEIFNNWGRVGATGKWYLDTIKDKEGLSKNAIINSENTVGFTGFYDPDAFDSSKIIFEFDSNSTNSDDDLMGCMFRFNINSGSTQQTKVVDTYLLITYESHGSGSGFPGYPYVTTNGLFKVKNGKFCIAEGNGKLPENTIPLQLTTDVAWVRDSGTNHFKRYRVEAVGNNIKVYQQEWENKKIIKDWELVIDYTDNDNPIMTGSYGVWACSQPYTQFTNINVSLSDEKTFAQSLLESNWREDSYRFVVNVDDSINSSFENSQSYNEILSRTLNDNIHLIQWGSDENEETMSKFIRDNNNLGLFIKSDDYNQLLNSTVDYIKNVLGEDSNNIDTILVGEYDIYITPEELTENTSNDVYPDGRWKIIHDPNYYENSMGRYQYSGVYQDDFNIDFSLTGKYIFILKMSLLRVYM